MSESFSEAEGSYVLTSSAYPYFGKPFILHTNSSKEGVGAVLEQEQGDGCLHPVAYTSRSLTRHEKNYGITKLEALGVVWAARHFRAYLYGHRCVVYTDHSPLKSILQARHPSGKLARWSQFLTDLDLDIMYRPGRANSNADALSWAPVGSTDEDQCGLTDGVEVAQVSSGLEPPRESEGVGMSELAELQRQDFALGEVLQFVQEGILPTDSKRQKLLVLEAPRFSVMEGILHYVDPPRKNRPRIAVQELMSRELLEEAHSGGVAGHFAIKGLYEKLARRYWWRGMYGDVYEFCKGCLTCSVLWWWWWWWSSE